MGVTRGEGNHAAGREALIVLALGMLALVAVFPEVVLPERSLSPGENLWFQDALLSSTAPEGAREILYHDPTPHWHSLPWDIWAASRLRNGELPLWQPHNGLGAPFLAAWQPSPFNPLKLPLLLSPHGAYDLYLVLRLLAAGAGAWAWLRLLGLSRLAGATGAVAFGLSGWCMTHFHYKDLDAVAWAPALLASIEWLARRPGPLPAAAAGAAGAAVLVSGHPTAAAGVGVVAAVCLVTRIAMPPGGMGRIRIVAWGGGAGLLALALSAVVWLPFLAYLAHGGGAARLALPVEGVDLARGMERLARGLAPGLFSPGPARFHEGHTFDAYLGGAGILLALLGWRRLKDPFVAFLALVAAGAAFGLPPFSGLLRLPGLRLVDPDYLVFLWPLGLAVLAAEGMARLEAGQASRLWVSLSAAGLVVAVPAILLLYVRAAGGPGVPWAMDPRGVALSAAALAGACGVAVASAWMDVRRRAWLLLLLPALLGVDLALQGRAAIPSRLAFDHPVPPGMTPLLPGGEGARPRSLGLPRVVRGSYAFHRSALLPFNNSVYGADELRSFQPMAPPGYRDLLNALDPNLEGRTGWLLSPWSLQSPLLNLAAVTHLVVPRPLPFEPRAGMAEVYRDTHVVIFRRPGALPRSRLVHAALPVPPGGGSEALRAVASGQVDPARTVLLEGLAAPVAGPGPLPGESVRLDREPERVWGEVVAGAPGWLVLAEAWMPGWQATVDGRPVPVLRAYGLLRAVAVPAGRHTVEFRYRPGSVAAGLALAAGGALSLALMLAWGLGRRPAK